MRGQSFDAKATFWCKGNFLMLGQPFDARATFCYEGNLLMRGQSFDASATNCCEVNLLLRGQPFAARATFWCGSYILHVVMLNGRTGRPAAQRFFIKRSRSQYCDVYTYRSIATAYWNSRRARSYCCIPPMVLH